MWQEMVYRVHAVRVLDDICKQGLVLLGHSSDAILEHISYTRAIDDGRSQQVADALLAYNKTYNKSRGSSVE
jgi:hypothetical protein